MNAGTFVMLTQACGLIAAGCTGMILADRGDIQLVSFAGVTQEVPRQTLVITGHAEPVEWDLSEVCECE